jgi:hypothetical protein
VDNSSIRFAINSPDANRAGCDWWSQCVLIITNRRPLVRSSSRAHVQIRGNVLPQVFEPGVSGASDSQNVPASLRSNRERRYKIAEYSPLPSGSRPTPTLSYSPEPLTR